MVSSPITSWQRGGEKVGVVSDVLFLGSKITGWWLQLWNQKMIAFWQENYDKPRQCVEKQRHHSADEGLYSGLPSGHVWLWELDREEGRAPKNWCLQTMVLEKTPKSPLDSKETKPINLKENQLWIPIARTDAEAEGPVFWRKSKRIPEKHPLLLYGLCQSLWLCRSQQTVENSSRDKNTRPPYLLPEKSVCRSRSSS